MKPRPRRSGSFAGAALVLLAALAVERDALAQRAYAAKGPSAVETKTLDASTRLVVPTGAGSYPLVVASHGFSASGDNQIGWAEHFASWGFVVAVPSFPSPLAPDTAANAGIIEDLVTRLRGPLAAANKVAAGAFGLEGHSAGGLATAVAAAKIAPAATVLFDPVDRDDAGKAAYGSLCTPVLTIFAGPSSCNNQAGWKAFASTAKGERVSFDVKGSTHCDGENAPRALCGTFCGGAATAARQDVYAHFATAFLLARVTGDAAAAAALADATMTADTEIAGITRAASTCAATPDAGTSGSSSSSSGGASAGDAGTSGGAAAAGSGDAPAGDASSDSGCGAAPAGLAASRASRVAQTLAALALAAALLLARRRR